MDCCLRSGRFCHLSMELVQINVSHEEWWEESLPEVKWPWVRSTSDALAMIYSRDKLKPEPLNTMIVPAMLLSKLLMALSNNGAFTLLVPAVLDTLGSELLVAASPKLQVPLFC